MAGRDADAQRRGPDGEPQGRAQVHGLAINPGVYRCGGADLQLPRAPGSPQRVRALVWCVEYDDSELPGIERWAGAEDQRAFQRIGVVGYEHHGETTVFAPRIVREAQHGRLCARP